MAATPIQERLARREDLRVNPAIGLLKKYLSSGKTAEDGFYQWLKLPMTQLFLGAVGELSDFPPMPTAPIDTNYVLIQYGMTQGLELAYRLLSNPSRVYPEVFSGKQPVSQEPLRDSYKGSVDEAIDGMI
jgi:hypothetical protein